MHPHAAADPLSGAADHVTGKLVSNIDIAPTIVAIAGASSRLDPDGKTR